MVTSSGIFPLETLCSFLTFNFPLRNVNTHLGFSGVFTRSLETPQTTEERIKACILPFFSPMWKGGRRFDAEMPRSPEIQKFPAKNTQKTPQVAKATISLFQLGSYLRNDHCHHHGSLFFLLFSFLFLMSVPADCWCVSP